MVQSVVAGRNSLLTHFRRRLVPIMSLALASALAPAAQASIFGIISNNSAAATDAAGIVTGQGNTAVILTNLAAGDLAGIDVVWALNGDNGAPLFELSANTAAVASFVSGGGVLMYHDRDVDFAETVLPGGAAFNVIRDFSDDADITVLVATTLVTNGPGGIVTNTTLDGGNSSSHGFTLSGDAPGALEILSRSSATEIVDFTYGFGGGDVYYSTIPLDFYLGASNNFRDIYAANVAAYADSLVGTPGVVPEPTQFLVWAGLAACSALGSVFLRRRRSDDRE